LYLHISTCAEDENLGYSTWSTIYPDKSIEMIDTEKHFIIDSIKDARFLVKTYITKRTYKINAQGIPKICSKRKDSIISHTKTWD
jgi:hypothetical protein